MRLFNNKFSHTPASKPKSTRKKWGFAALFSTIAILAIGAGLIMLSVNKSREYAKQAECLSVALFREGERGNVTDQVAIAQNIINRTESPRYPKTVCDVINDVRTTPQGRRVAQYSFVLERHLHPSQERAARTHWATTQQIARDILTDWNTNGRNYTVHVATRRQVGASENYHTPGVRPAWESIGIRGCELKSIGKIGAHIHYEFYAEADPRGHNGCRTSLARGHHRPVTVQMTRTNNRNVAPVRRTASR